MRLQKGYYSLWGDILDVFTKIPAQCTQLFFLPFVMLNKWVPGGDGKLYVAVTLCPGVTGMYFPAAGSRANGTEINTKSMYSHQCMLPTLLIMYILSHSG